MKLVLEEFRDLISEDIKVFAFLCIAMKDRTPQVPPAWCYPHGEFILINSAWGVKDSITRNCPTVAEAKLDSANPYHDLQIRGRVVKITEDCANEQINPLSQKYIGKTFTPEASDEIRVFYKIYPDRVVI